VFVPLDINYVIRMRYIVICDLHDSTVSFRFISFTAQFSIKKNY